MLPGQPLKKDEIRSLLQSFPTPPKPGTTATRWAHLTGLVDAQGLTAEGQIVLAKDPFLESTVTDWLFHFNLSESDRIWHHFIHDFLPQHPSFIFDDVWKECDRAFSDVPVEQAKKVVQVILKSYQGAIAKSNFIVKAGKQYSRETPAISNPFTTGYLLAKYWEKRKPEQPAILVSNLLLPEFGFIHILGLSPEQLKEQFDQLAQCEIVEKRSARPHTLEKKPFRVAETDEIYQIFPGWNDPLKLLEQAFDHDIATPNRPLTQSLAEILDDEDDSLDISSLFEWTSGLSIFEGGSKMITNLAS